MSAKQWIERVLILEIEREIRSLCIAPNSFVLGDEDEDDSKAACAYKQVLEWIESGRHEWSQP